MPELKEYTHRYYLTAGECDAQQCMPIPLVARRVIEVATEHANSWGVGYARLIQNNEAWVLSRLTIELSSYPGINSDYSLTTWVEGFNRHFSESLAEIGVTTEEQIRTIAKNSCVEGETIHNMAGDVTPDELYDAIVLADALGQQLLGTETEGC